MDCPRAEFWTLANAPGNNEQKLRQSYERSRFSRVHNVNEVYIFLVFYLGYNNKIYCASWCIKITISRDHRDLKLRLEHIRHSLDIHFKNLVFLNEMQGQKVVQSYYSAVDSQLGNINYR